MKKKSRVKNQKVKRAGSKLSAPCVVGAALLAGAAFVAAAAEEPKEVPSFEGPEAGNNWVEIGAGGMLSSGSNAQAEQSRQLPNNPFGGIQDLHFQQDVSKGVTFTLDGRAIADN